MATLLLASPGARAESTDVVDDDAIVARVESQGTAMIQAGKAVKLKVLRQQLSRSHPCRLSLAAAEAAPLTPAVLYRERAPGVLVVGVLERAKKKNKNEKTRYEMAGCTGFALTADGIFVTNYHVVDNPEGETIVVMTADGQIAPVSEVLAADKLLDVAILRAPGLRVTPLPLAQEAPPAGTAVWALSHPDHNFYSLTGGVVSRRFMAHTDDGNTPQFAITADFGSGSSGGPILDVTGQVVGMVCSTTSVYWEDENGKDSDLQMVFKHCVPASSIRRLIEPVSP